MENQALPNHVAIIMDGNGRWALERGKPRTFGHREGAKTLKKLCRYAFDRGLKYLSVFAFSTENFKRSEEEVSTLMNLFIEYFQKEFDFVKKDHVKVVFSGRRNPLPEKVLSVMDRMMEETKENDGPVFNICLNYGGQAEIADMTKNISKLVLDGKIDIDKIDETLIQHHLYQDLPPVDFVIRTSGELRISNFMLYQVAYAEFYFPKVYFPDFDEEQFALALLEYQKRNRRFGGVKA